MFDVEPELPAFEHGQHLAQLGRHVAQERLEFESAEEEFAAHPFGVHPLPQESFGERPHVLHDIEVRRQLPADGLDQCQGLCQQEEIRRHADSVTDQEACELVEHLADVDVTKGAVEVVLDEVGDVGLDAVHTLEAAVVRQSQDGGGDLSFVALDQAEHEVAQLLALPVGEHADHAVVEQADHVPRLHQDVPRMRVRVVEAVFEDLLADERRTSGSHHFQLDPLRGVFRQLRDLGSLDVFEREDGAGTQGPVDFGDMDALVAGEIGRKAVHVVRFGREVQFAADRVGEFADDVCRLKELGSLHHSFQEPGKVRHDFEIGLDRAPDPRPLDLHHHVVAVVGHRFVDLGH